ncbi:MAG: AraC family transcriptional regulator [Lachnospiraceae bacterium]|jgi:AraC-like DNA-binding protein|nr:AraC family transcriptional regulator [Lachnospiraceae bacterium]MDD4525542.1 AraC family transcriptional regulator [Lachnospiraceae bacterium]
MKAFHEVRDYQSDFMVWHEQYRDISFVAHWHREIELIYVRSGTAEIHVTDRSFSAGSGDLILCDSGDIHYCDRHSSDSCLDFVLFDTSFISTHYKYSYLASHIFSKAGLASRGLDTQLEYLLAVLDDELGNRQSFYQEIVTSAIRGFWYHLLREFPERTDKTAMQDRRTSMITDFQNVLTFLEEHYGENISLDDAAEMMSFSSSHFSRLFKQMTGTGFVRYLSIIRISQAADLLTTTDLKITDIAYQCGFSSIRTFNRVFLEVTGYTPTEYSKRPESKSYNFTYYRSSSDLISKPEDNPTIIKGNG